MSEWIGGERGDEASGLVASVAMEMASGWTVILKEGLYMNPSTASNHNFILCHTSEFPGFEIVGLKDVRILFTVSTFVRSRVA